MLTGKCIIVSGIVKSKRNKLKIDSGIRADRKVWSFLASYLESIHTNYLLLLVLQFHNWVRTSEIIKSILSDPNLFFYKGRFKQEPHLV